MKRLLEYDPSCAKMVSIDQKPDRDENELGLDEKLQDEKAENPEEAAIGMDTKSRVMGMLGILTERERYVIRKRFGLDGDVEQSLQRVGNTLGLSRERIRQTEAKALGKIRRAQEDEEQTGCNGPAGGNGRVEPLNATINK
jgi:RNA polymerase primary sigma factor